MTERHEESFELLEMKREERTLINEIITHARKRRSISAQKNRIQILRKFVRMMSPIPEGDDWITDEEGWEDKNNKRDLEVIKVITDYCKTRDNKSFGDSHRYEIKSVSGEPLCHVTASFIIRQYSTSEPEKKRIYRIIHDVKDGEMYRYAYEITPEDAIQFQQAMQTLPGGLKDFPLYSQIQTQPANIEIEIKPPSTNETQPTQRLQKLSYEDNEDISTNIDKSDEDHSPTQKKSNKQTINIKTDLIIKLKQKLDALHKRGRGRPKKKAIKRGRGRPKKKATEQSTSQDQPDAITRTTVI